MKCLSVIENHANNDSSDVGDLSYCINEFSTVFNINDIIYLLEDISNLFCCFTLRLNYNSEEEGYLQQQIHQLYI